MSNDILYRMFHDYLRGNITFQSGMDSKTISGITYFNMSGATSGYVLTSNLNGVGTWQAPPAGGGGGGVLWRIAALWMFQSTLTNIGTAYKNVYAVGDTGLEQLIDFTDFTQYRICYHLNKVGSGTQSWRVTDGTNALGEVSDAGAAGHKKLDTAWQTLPAWATGEKLLRPQGKSTTGTDDPVFYAAVVYLK